MRSYVRAQEQPGVAAAAGSPSRGAGGVQARRGASLSATSVAVAAVLQPSPANSALAGRRQARVTLMQRPRASGGHSQRLLLARARACVRRREQLLLQLRASEEKEEWMRRPRSRAGSCGAVFFFFWRGGRRYGAAWPAGLAPGSEWSRCRARMQPTTCTGRGCSILGSLRSGSLGTIAG